MRACFLVALLATSPACAQPQTPRGSEQPQTQSSDQALAPRGSDATFEVGTWNIRQFGDPRSAPDDEVQTRNAAAILAASEIDLWAIQEVTSRSGWNDLLSRLRDYGYAGYLSPEPTFGDYKVGFLYDSTVVSVLGVRQPLAITGSYGGKQPYELHAQVTVGGATRRVRVVVFHAKNGVQPNDLFNRTQGARKLKRYADARIRRGEAVILLGDYNDFLTRSKARGVERSPYEVLMQDPNYVAATRALEDDRVATFCRNRPPVCGNGATIDHIVYTANFAARLVEVGRYDEALTGVADYVRTTSDHAPVFARFSFDTP